ncbi:ABC transporter ATP-binding protein [Haloferula chungangensis]|uniref:ABC transporter ATP-binding protein n=1 Tax=Haloferula chungangensis TaxID=1048331 RepID=A0ABW2L202_9BACT
MKKFWPYFSLLSGARGMFAAGIAAGIIYALASGFGMPLMIKTVFPIIFESEKTPAQVEMAAATAAVEKAKDDAAIAEGGIKGQFAEIRVGIKRKISPDSIRGYFVERWGEEAAPRAILIAACSVIPLVALVRGLAGFLNVYFITGAGLHVLLKIQQSVFVKLQKLPLGFFSGRKTGDLISRVINDTVMLQTMITSVSNDLLKQPFTLAAALGYLVYDSIENSETTFLIICLISIPVVVLPIRMIGKKLMYRAARMQHEGGDNSGILAETLNATKEIRAFNLEDLMAGRFLDGVVRWTKLHLKVIKYRFSTPPLIEIIAATAVAVALGYGATKGLSLERFIAVVVALYMCYDPAKKLGEVHNRLKQGEASLDRLEVILHAEEGVKDPENPVEISEVKGSLKFDNVSFFYDKTAALKDVSVEIPAGQIVALVGPSGAGKTTFASMVPRFFDPNDGSVTLDGVDLRDLRVKQLRNHITLVPQEAILLSGTVSENIRLGRLDASDEEVINAAKQASADDFVKAKEQGYDTQVGERGAELSGGQRQRISIARAFLKDAPVLILDEATGALDANSEAEIQEQLAGLAKGRTTLIIAHRFSSIRIADRVLVFDGGRIVGDGTFEELEASHPLFQSLLNKQRH